MHPVQFSSPKRERPEAFPALGLKAGRAQLGQDWPQPGAEGEAENESGASFWGSAWGRPQHNDGPKPVAPPEQWHQR